jgi:hypothetical protein
MSQNHPAYGVRTCGKQVPGLSFLGPCREDPDHTGACRYPMDNGHIQIVERTPTEVDADILKYRNALRKQAKISFLAMLLTIACLIWNLVNIFTG